MELLTVIAIIGIIVGTSLVSLKPSKDNAILRSAQEEVTASIKLAQSYALQGKNPAGASLTKWGFKFINDTQYSVFYTDSSEIETNLYVQDLRNGAVLSSPNFGNASRVTFDIPNANIALPTTPLTLTFSFSGKTKTITINSKGLVTEN